MADFPRDELFEDHAKALGQLCAVWADLEFLVNQMIWELANLERGAGACITAQIGTPVARSRALVALVHLRGGDNALIKELNKFTVYIDSLARQRNRFVHDPWALAANGAIERVHVTADRELQFDFIPTEVKEIDALTQKIHDAADEFSELEKRIVFELPPWPRTQFEQSHGIRAHGSKTENES